MSVENDDWPDFEIEERFDWSLSMRDIERKYGTKEPVKFIIDKNTYLPSIKKEKKIIDVMPCKRKPFVSQKFKKPAIKFPEWVQRYLDEPQPNFHE